MSKKLLFNLNKNVSQNYTYVKYTGTIVTAINTLEKPIKNAILKGDTKYRDIDTGEILDSFDRTKNLELVSVKMPVLMTTNQDNILGKCSVNVNSAYGGYIKKLTDTTGEFKVTNSSQDVKIRVDGVNTIIGRDKWCYVTVLFGEDMSNVNFNMRRGWTLLKDNRTLVFKELTYGGNDIGGLILTSNQGIVLNQLYTFEVISVVPILSTWTFDDYEPYKTNILSVSSDLTLRSKGITFDELNILTGKLTQRIDEDGEILNEEIISFVELTITDQDDNIINQINSFDNTTHIITSSDTIPPIFEGYIATKESVE